MGSQVYTVSLQRDVIHLSLPDPLVLQGDVKFSLTQKFNLDLLHLTTKPKLISSVPHGKLLHFWINTYFVGLKISSPLTHSFLSAGQLGPRTRKHSASASCLPTRLNSGKDGSARRTLVKTVSSAIPIANRFAALSTDETPTSSMAASFHNEEIGMLRVCLSKTQIDKAAKDTSGRYSEDFSLCLNLRRSSIDGEEGEEGFIGTNGMDRSNPSTMSCTVSDNGAGWEGRTSSVSLFKESSSSMKLNRKFLKF